MISFKQLSLAEFFTDSKINLRMTNLHFFLFLKTTWTSMSLFRFPFKTITMHRLGTSKLKSGVTRYKFVLCITLTLI